MFVGNKKQKKKEKKRENRTQSEQLVQEDDEREMGKNNSVMEMLSGMNERTTKKTAATVNL